MHDPLASMSDPPSESPESPSPTSWIHLLPDPDPHSFREAEAPLSQNSAPNSLLFSSHHPQTLSYVCAMLSTPSQTLSTAAQRAIFLSALLGPDDLAADADDDVPLLRQLESRVSVLVAEAALAIPTAPVRDADPIVALLALVATRWPVLLDAMERAGATTLVVAVMKTFRERPALVARAMATLSAFAVTDPMRKRVMFDAGMDITLELMSVYRTNRRVQRRATTVIANVAFGCAHRKRRIARQGAVKRIIDAMATFPTDLSIQLHGALTIRNLTHDAQVNQYIAGNEGAVEAICSTLLRFRSGAVHAALRFQCVLALESLCLGDERNRLRVADIDSLVMSAVDVSSSSPSPSVEPPPTPYSPDEEEEYVNEDGDIIVEDEQVLAPDVTAEFRHGAALCPGRSATKLIMSPSASSSGGSERTTPSLILDERKLNLGQDDAEFWNASGVKATPDHRKSIIRAIVHTVRRDPNDTHLLEVALSLLTLIALHRGDVQKRIVDLGGIHVAIAAIRRHEKCPTLVAKACALIRCLCVQESNRSQVTSGLPVLISAAREHCKDADVVREVASALSNAVFEHEKNRAWVVNKGGVDAIVCAMNECGENDVMVLEACVCALRSFVDSSNSGALSASQEGAVRAAVTALDATKNADTTGQRIVQEQAVMLLVDLARLAPQTMEDMMEIDAADWIENALAKLPSRNYEELHEAADKLINVLTEQSKSDPYKKGSHGMTPPSPTSVYGRLHSRGFFSAFSLPRRSPVKGTSLPRRRSVIRRRMPISRNGSEPKIKRLSARFMKSTALSGTALS